MMVWMPSKRIVCFCPGWWSLFRVILVLLSLSGSPLAQQSSEATINLVGIVDESAEMSALLQIHSIILNMAKPEALQVNYLLFPDKLKHSMPSEPSITQSFQTYMRNPLEGDFQERFKAKLKVCFPSLRVRYATWSPPTSMKYLRNQSFDQPHIFARFYLPHIFSDLDTFIYLDNDVIVNADIAILAQHPMLTSPGKVVESTKASTMSSSSNGKFATTQAPGLSAISGNRISQRRDVARDLPTNSVKDLTVIYQSPTPATIGMVLEDHPIYRNYLTNHFNQTHPLFLRAKQHLGNTTFLNAGVFIVNAKLWRRNHLTKQVEALMKETVESGYQVYDSAVGDQGPFYLIFHSIMAALPPEYNMRRFPKRTFLMLDRGAQGIIHYASVTHGDALYFCRYPALHEMLSRAATPLYLTTVQSFAAYHCSFLSNASEPAKTMAPVERQQLHPLAHDCAELVRLCRPAVSALLESLTKLKITPTFVPGKASLSTWPLKDSHWPDLPSSNITGVLAPS